MSSLRTVVYVSHSQQQCGVYQFGKRIGKVLGQSTSFDFRYRECQSVSDLQSVIQNDQPDVVIYNYYPSTMPWLTPGVTQQIAATQIGTVHEVTQEIADQLDNRLFDYHIAADPTLLLRNPLVFKTGRFVAAYQNRFQPPDITTIGSFGFGTDGKGLEYLIACVQNSFDRAVIRLHLPAAQFGDQDGSQARKIVTRCQSLIFKPDITLEATHDFLDEPRLLDFLARNTCNVFVYNRVNGRGISSAPDYALAVGRPLAIRRTSMMRHLWGATPSICLEDHSLPEIIESGVEPIQPFSEEWCEANLVWDYERIVRSVLSRPYAPRQHSVHLMRRAIRKLRRLTGRRGTDTVTSSHPSTGWMANYSGGAELSSAQSYETYAPAELSSTQHLNRILNDEARATYRRTISELFRWLPDLMARKIPEANIQQAYTLDTVVRLLGTNRRNKKILCVGCFEDSAAMGLKRLGLRIDEIDPVLNYDLSEFCDRPTTHANSYDLIFSVSVIEHVQDDQTFLKQMAGLLKPGGFIVLTCDFQEGYQPGDHKPSCDWRLYTQQDITGRLMKSVPDCDLLDEPQWDCRNPDFQWEGCNYSFAGIVLQKRNPNS
jgi:SAM-dependent methyltransferase